MSNTLIKIGVFAFILNSRREILLCHRRDYDLWNLPGGGLENNEVPWEGVVREVREETGLRVKVKSLTGIYYKPRQQEIVFCFWCLKQGGKISLNEEADRIKFFNTNNLPDNISQKQKERILDFFANNISGNCLKTKVVLKVQKGKDFKEDKK